jgi:hypothetical protein
MKGESTLKIHMHPSNIIKNEKCRIYVYTTPKSIMMFRKRK